MLSRITLGVVLAVTLLAAGEALAHAQSKSTTPADGAVLADAPATIAMTFDSPIRVTAVSLTDADGRTIPFASSDGAASTSRYEATPPRLDAGRYTVDWRGLSDDGHPMQGRFSFTVE